MHLVALTEDRAGTQEPDAGHHLGSDACRVGRSFEDFESKSREQARADANQPQGLDARRVPVELALEADRNREDGGDKQPEGEIDVAEEWQLLSPCPAGRRVDPCLVAPRETQAGQANRGCSRNP